MPATTRASVCFTVAMFLQKGLLSISTPIFTRLMSTVEYEEYSVYYAWSTMLTIVATLNLSSGVLNNQLVKGKHRTEIIVSSMEGVSSLWAFGFALISCCLFILGFRFNSMPIFLWVFMLFSFMFTPAYELWAVSKRFVYEYREPCIVMVIVALLTFIFPLIGVLISPDHSKGDAKIFATIAVNFVVGIIFWFSNLYRGKYLFVKSIWKEAIIFNLPLIPHFLSLSILNQSDKIMIQYLGEPGQAGIYSVAHTIAAMIQLLMTAINYSLVPWTYQNLKAGNCRTIAERTNTILYSVSIVLACTMLFAPEIMWIMAPDAYHEAIYIIPPMAAGIFFSYLYQLYGRIELYHEKTKGMMFGSIGCAAVNLILNYIFISLFGYMAAAYTTLFCNICLCLMHWILVGRLVHKLNYKEIPYDSRVSFTASIAVLLVALLMPILYMHTTLRWNVILCICIIAIINRRKIYKIMFSISKKQGS